MNRLPARDLNGLLKFCIENTRAEDASGDVPSTVRPEDITPGMPDTFDLDLYIYYRAGRPICRNILLCFSM